MLVPLTFAFTLLQNARASIDPRRTATQVFSVGQEVDRDRDDTREAPKTHRGDRSEAVAAPPQAVDDHATRPRSTRPDDEDDDGDDRRAPETTITVTARRLDDARARIEPSLGAAVYAISNDDIESRPGGETRTLGSVLVQAPGVVRDARGGLVIRGAQGGAQYRLNGVILPAGIGDFGEMLSARLAARTELLTGALPAAYGLAAGGVVNVTTKDAHYLVGGQAELYGGAHAAAEPAIEWSTATGATSLFVSGSYRRSDIGLLAPTRTANPEHDGSRELEGFAYVDHVIDAGSRVSVIAGSVNERQQIPAIPVVGIADAASRFGDVSGHNQYGILAYQHTNGPLTLQASIHAVVTQRRLRPDATLHPLIDGSALAQDDRSGSYGLQVEGAYGIGDRHVVRTGLIATIERLHRFVRSTMLPDDRSTSAFASRATVSMFAQDEWLLASKVTLNVGVRGDRIAHTDGVTHLQPRTSLVWRPSNAVTIHAGYARSVASAPLEDSVLQPDGIRAIERDDLLDAGAQWRSGRLTLELNGYSREARNLFATRFRDDAPFGEAFSYAQARLIGVEAVATYRTGPLSAWTNLALSRATGIGISSGQQTLAPLTLAYIADHRVPLDTDRRVVASGGAAWKLGDFLLSGDVVAGSGVPRTPPNGAPNSGRNPAYGTVDLAMVYHAHLIDHLPTDLRLDLQNAFNRRVVSGDSTAIGGGAIGWSEPRGLYLGIEQSF